MAAGRGGPGPTVEEVEAARGGGSCSPVVCILSVSLCLLLAALIIVTALHTHTKLQAADDGEPQGGCPLLPGAPGGLRGFCRPTATSVSLRVGDGSACTGWFVFACPAAGGGKLTNVTQGQALILGLARTACEDGRAAVDAVLRNFFGVANVTSEVLNPAFKC